MIAMAFKCDCFYYLYCVGSKIEQLQEEVDRITERIDFFRTVLSKTKNKANQKLIRHKIDGLLDKYYDKLEQIKKL